MPLTVADMMLKHLSAIKLREETSRYPFGTTQYGMSRALGVARGYIAIEANRLVDEGFLRSFLARVDGGRKRMKVYLPTAKGLAEAGRIARECDDPSVRKPPPDGGDGWDLMKELMEMSPMTGPDESGPATDVR